jgi:hypothetical protein
MFATLSLHDATLKGLHLSWADGRCSLEFDTVEDGMRELVFSGVTEMHVPRTMPWGPSVSVNTTRQIGADLFEVNLQSGDVLKIQANGWQFGSENSA